MDIIEKAFAAYNAKLCTGKYDHYTQDMLYSLLCDCINEVLEMDEINSANHND